MRVAAEIGPFCPYRQFQGPRRRSSETRPPRKALGMQVCAVKSMNLHPMGKLGMAVAKAGLNDRCGSSARKERPGVPGDHGNMSLITD